MKTNIKILGLAICVTLGPVAASAQNLGQDDLTLGGAISSDGGLPTANTNPFTAAAGADRFYQNNSLTGATQPSSGAGLNASNNLSGNLGGNLVPADPNAPAINANPFASAAGSDKFYQNNSLTGAAQSNNLSALGSGASGAAAWATTP